MKNKNIGGKRGRKKKEPSKYYLKIKNNKNLKKLNYEECKKMSWGTPQLIQVSLCISLNKRRQTKRMRPWQSRKPL